MTTRDRYKNFAELSQAEHDGIDFTCHAIPRDSSFVILAPHGGGIEPGTTEIARAIAAQSFSFYTFEGIKQNGNEMLHITSSLFDEPKCLRLLESCQVAVTIHGCKGKAAIVHVGGLHHGLQTQIIAALWESGFDAREAGPPYPGNEPGNLCNKGRAGQGVQLEISEGLRRAMFKGLTRQERQTTTPVFDKFVGTVQATLLAHRHRLTDTIVETFFGLS